MSEAKKRLLNDAGLDGSDFKEALIELCKSGMLTCTSGLPGETRATYAVAWLPLDDPEQYSVEVQRRHEVNMRQVALTDCRIIGSFNPTMLSTTGRFRGPSDG